MRACRGNRHRYAAGEGGWRRDDLTLARDSLLQDIEAISLAGSGSNTLTLGLSDVLASSSSTDTLRVEGEAGNVVRVIDLVGWRQLADMGTANIYHVCAQGTARLHIDADTTITVWRGWKGAEMAVRVAAADTGEFRPRKRRRILAPASRHTACSREPPARRASKSFLRRSHA